MSNSVYQILQASDLAALGALINTACIAGNSIIGNPVVIPGQGTSNGLPCFAQGVILPSSVPGGPPADYQMIMGENLTALAASVNAAIANGMLPYGGLIPEQFGNSDGQFSIGQPMISEACGIFTPGTQGE